MVGPTKTPAFFVGTRKHGNDRRVWVCKIDGRSLTPIDDGSFQKVKKKESVDRLVTTIDRDLEAILQKKDYADVTLVLPSGKKIAGHKVILAARSKYFNAMFSNGMQESHSNEIAIREVNESAFETMIEFMYSDRLDFRDNPPSALLNSAVQYVVQSLSDRILNRLKSDDVLFMSDVLGLIQVSQDHNMADLREGCINLMLRCWESVPKEIWNVIVEKHKDIMVSVLSFLQPKDHANDRKRARNS